MSKANKTQIYASIYDGKFDISFDCPGLCSFALCPIMPPNGSEECVYRENGSCMFVTSKIMAVEALRRALGKTMKELVDEFK